MGGILRLIGDADRPPVKEALDACGFHADMVAAVGALAALAERRQSGRGQHVDISTQEVAFSRNVNGVLVWQFDRRLLKRAGGALNYGRATVRCIWALRDGYCFHSLMTGRFGAPANKALSDWMDECGADNPLAGVDWERYNRSTLDAATRARWESAIEAFFTYTHAAGPRHRRTATRHQRHGDRRTHRRACRSSPDRAQILAVARAMARSQAVSLSVTGSERFSVAARCACRESCARAAVRRAGAGFFLGAGGLHHDQDARRSRLRNHQAGIRARAPACRASMCRLRASRAGNLDDKPWFAHLNTSKRSLALDLKQPASREVLEPLIDWADVVVENFSPGTLEKLGLDYRAARRAQSRHRHGVRQRVRPDRAAREELGRRRHGRGLERPHAAHRLAGSQPGDSQRRSVRRRHRSVCHGGGRDRGARASAFAPARLPHRCFDV